MKLLTRLTGAIALTLSLGACGMLLRPGSALSQLTGPSGQSGSSGYQTQAVASGSQTKSAHARRGSGKLSRMARMLGLSVQQRQAIAAIARQYRTQVKTGAASQNRKALAALLVAPTVDTAALTTWIQDHIQTREAKLGSRVDMLAQIRDVLTPSQRTELVTRLSQQSPKALRKHHPRLGRMIRGLHLDASQHAALRTLRQAIGAARKAQGSTLKQARVAFIQNGDKAPLLAALQAGVLNHLPVGDMVTFAAGLNRVQRQRLVKDFDRFHRR